MTLFKDLINLIAKKIVIEVVELKGNRRGEKIAKACVFRSTSTTKSGKVLPPIPVNFYHLIR